MDPERLKQAAEIIEKQASTIDTMEQAKTALEKENEELRTFKENTMRKEACAEIIDTLVQKGYVDPSLRTEKLAQLVASDVDTEVFRKNIDLYDPNQISGVEAYKVKEAGEVEEPMSAEDAFVNTLNYILHN